MRQTLTTVGARVALALTVLLAGAGSAAAQSEIVLQASTAPTRAGKWVIATDTTAAGGMLIRHPDGAAAKVSSPLASPANYFELTFQAEAGKPYRLWIRGRADRNYWGNDSVFAQFDKSVTSSGGAVYRVGTTSGAVVNLEECSSCGLAGWKWQDNGYGNGVLGPAIYFASSGTQKLRIQTREDGLAIDQIVLSAGTYLKTRPSGILSATTTTLTTSSTTTATDIKLAAASAPTRAGKWTVVSDASAVGGSALRHANAGAAKITTALASPANYFEMTFNAVANTPYRIWVHGRADSDYWANDSVFVQFSGSVTSSSTATYRIGTTSAAVVNLEDCRGCGLKGWKWQDNGYGSGVLGPAIYFATTGTQKIRVQTREDGLRIDQIILSPSTYLKSAPASTSTTTTTATTTTTSTTTTSTTTTSTSSTTLKVLTWNIHHGVGTDGKYDIPRFVNWMAKWRPDVVMITEAEKYTGWGYEDQPARFKYLLEQATGLKWYYVFAQEWGNWTSNGKGNLLLSRFPFISVGREVISYDRTIGIGTISVNGRNISLMVTHLDPYSKAYRYTQAKQVVSIASTWPEARIIGGDFNAWPDQTSIAVMTSPYYDSWAEAAKMGTATAPSDISPYGATKKGRIDYIFHSKKSTVLVLKKVQVPDTRVNGVMPSDHRPVLATYEVR